LNTLYFNCIIAYLRYN